MSKIEITSEERVFNNYFKVDKAEVKHTLENGDVLKYSRMKLTRPDAVAALILNVDTEKVILVKQFRYPIADRESENILEIVAGKMDAGETPEQSMCREIMEEVGYKIEESDLTRKKSIYISPGYSTEIIHIFIVKVKDSMKVSNGGGVETEQENLEIVEMDAGEFMSACRKGEIADAKTIISANELLISSIEGLLDYGVSVRKQD
jgi:ADP-ribose pyrophosphatase